jgi:hypothetical protein
MKEVCRANVQLMAVYNHRQPPHQPTTIYHLIQLSMSGPASQRGANIERLVVLAESPEISQTRRCQIRITQDSPKPNLREPLKFRC